MLQLKDSSWDGQTERPTGTPMPRQTRRSIRRTGTQRANHAIKHIDERASKEMGLEQRTEAQGRGKSVVDTNEAFMKLGILAYNVLHS